MMAIMIFSALPLVTVREEHITVGLFDTEPRRVCRRQQQQALDTMVMTWCAGRVWTDRKTLSIGVLKAAPGVLTARMVRGYAINTNPISGCPFDCRYSPDPA